MDFDFIREKSSESPMNNTQLDNQDMSFTNMFNNYHVANQDVNNDLNDLENDIDIIKPMKILDSQELTPTITSPAGT